jgi:hypothetical protein
MKNALRAGFVYFAIVFTVGFVLGTIRVLLMAPRTGELIAVLIELPLMLTAAWFVCSSLLVRLQVGPRVPDRTVMGLSAFVFLFIAEFVFSVCVFGNPVKAVFLAYLTPHGFIGLLGQLAFAAFPLLQLTKR